jgi:membrane protease YdiL (CAAX protease family)
LAVKRTVLFSRRCFIDFVTAGLLLPLSLALTASANRLAGGYLKLAAPEVAWIATAAIPSCIVIGCLYALLSDKHALSWPRLQTNDRSRVLLLSAIWLMVWLAGSIAFAMIAGHWIVYARGLPAVAAFLVFGPLGEELLFRGLIYERVQALRPHSALWPVLISSFAFSAHHLWLDTAPEGLALTQVLFTIPMGIVLALLRHRTASVWPGFLLHVATNFPATL